MTAIYAVASSKGGVGKTTTTANLGAALAAAGHDVAVVDGDIGMANLGNGLGVEVTGATLQGVLAGEAETAAACYEGPAGLTVLAGGTSIEAFRKADPSRLGDVLADLEDHDYVLVDTGAGLSHDTVLPLGLADEVLLVSTTERDALVDTEKTREVATRLGGTVRGVVLTMVDPAEPNAAEVEDRLDAPVIEAIPRDEAVPAAVAAAAPLVTHAPESPAAEAYRALAATLTGEASPEPEAEQTEATATTAPDADPETALAEEESAATDADGETDNAPNHDADGDTDDAEPGSEAPTALDLEDPAADDEAVTGGDSDEAATGGDGDDEAGVAETELVEEAEPGADALAGDGEPTDAEGTDFVEDAEARSGADDDDGDEEKGFLGRLLG
jgi:septum site-determining protein MinD